MALLPWLPAPTPFEPKLQVGAWLTLWCWAKALLLPALPWLGSLLSGCIGLAKASHSASGGSSQVQALQSETCNRKRAASQHGAPHTGTAAGGTAQGQCPGAATWSQGQTKPMARHNPELLMLGISLGPFDQKILLCSYSLTC